MHQMHKLERCSYNMHADFSHIPKLLTNGDVGIIARQVINEGQQFHMLIS